MKAVWSISFLLLVNCAHSRFTYRDLQQQTAPKPQPGEKILATTQIESDLDLLQYALERGYGGRHFVPAQNWQAMQKRLRHLRGKSNTVAHLCDEIEDALWQLPDAHSKATRWLSLEHRNLHCGTLNKQALRKATVGRNYGADEKSKPWLAGTVSVGKASFGVLSITSFPSRDDPVWTGFDNAVVELRKTDGVVIDLRGNGGGDDSRGYELAQALLDQPDVPPTYQRVHTRQTPETLTLLLNTFDRIGRSSDGSLAVHLQSRYSETQTGRDRVLASRAPEDKVTEISRFALHVGPKAFAGPVAVLVDADCASSCESTLEVLRYFPKTRVFGQRTAGYVHFGNVGSLILPQSGIYVGIPTKYNEYPRGQFYDKIGFEPDVTVADGENALDVATTWLRTKVEK